MAATTQTLGATAHATGDDTVGGFFRQPTAVWAVAFACVVSFMGIGLVDPILPAIAGQLDATPSQVTLLFTSYMAVTGIAMLVTGAVSSRIGAKKTLLGGLALIIGFAALAGASGSIGEIVGFRAGWGLGNALFIATSLATIVGASRGSLASSVILYEAALGLGIASGPLLGGLLGDITWRAPFFGTATLMSIAFVAIAVKLPRMPKATHASGVLDPLRALRHRGLLLVAMTALFYNMGFFTILGYAPFPLEMDAHSLGLVFFGWGLCLAVASVFVAPRLQARFGTVPVLLAALALIVLDLIVMALGASMPSLLAVAIVVVGLFLGVVNTLITQCVMRVSPVERSVASASYSFLRFTGAALSPYVAGKLGEHFGATWAFTFGAVAVALAVVTMAVGRRHLLVAPEVPHSELARA